MRTLIKETVGIRPYVPATEIRLEHSTFPRSIPTGSASHCSNYIFEATNRPFWSGLQSFFDALKILAVLAFIITTWSVCYGADQVPTSEAGRSLSSSETARPSSGAAASALTSEPSKGLATGLVNQTLATPSDGGDPEAIHGTVSADVSLSMGPDYRAHVFLVEGNASYAGQPLSNAKIIVRLNSAEDSQSIETTTQADGSYSLRVALGSAPNEAVDWSVEGRDEAHRPAHLEGRQIILANDESITTLSQQLEFHVPQGRPVQLIPEVRDASI